MFTSLASIIFRKPIEYKFILINLCLTHKTSTVKKALFILLLVFVSLSGNGQQQALGLAGSLYKAAVYANYGSTLPIASFYKLVASMVILDSNGMLDYSDGYVLTKKSKKWVNKMSDNNFVDGVTIDYNSLQYMITKNQVRLDQYANPTRKTADYINNVIGYKYALADAQVRFKQHVHTGRNLKCITPEDLIPPIKGVEDTLIAGIRYFRVLSWKASPQYFLTVDSVNHLRYYKSNWNYPLFVTVAPELKKWFAENENSMPDVRQFKIRMAQLLGMPPGTDYGYMVGLWVQYEDLFRPTYDSSIAHVGYLQDLTKETTHPQYLAWLQTYFDGSYTNATLFGNYPFTGLGYTYDSSPDNFSHIGMSEFITNGGTKQYISYIYTTKEFYERLDEWR